MPNRYKLLTAILCLTAGLLAGCGGGGGPGEIESTLTMDVDGTPVTSKSMSSGVDVAGRTMVLATGDDWWIEFTFPGTTTGDFDSDSTSSAQVIYSDADGNSFYSSDVIEGSSYTITITSYDSETIEGTFTITVVGPDLRTHAISGSFKLALPKFIMSDPYGGPEGGTYFGIFRVQGQVLEGTNPDPPYEEIWGPMQIASFRITIRLEHLATAAGSGVYNIVHANLTDPFFGCNVGGCVPTPPTSIATLPVPPGTPTPSGQSQAGQGFLLQFDNGSSLVTQNSENSLYTSTDARTISNVLGTDQTWMTLDAAGDSLPEIKFGDTYSSLKPETRSMTWSLTKSAL